MPLSYQLLNTLTEVVHNITAAWMGVHVTELKVTGSYACREYGNGAVIRWHVDPAETQPLTAIIHIADDLPDPTGDVVQTAEEQQACINNEGEFAIPCMPSNSTRWHLSFPSNVTSFDCDSQDLNPSNVVSEHDDDLHHIDLQPGQLLLVQSAKLPHARLLPYRGQWYANAFVHLAPIGWALQDKIFELGLNI